MCHFPAAGPAPALPSPPPQSAAPMSQAEFEAPRPPGQSKAAPFLYFLGLLLVAGVYWRFMRPVPGLPVPAGAFQDQNSFFAVRAPLPGWRQTPPQKITGEFVEAAVFEKPEAMGPLRASFKVLVHPGPLPDFTPEMTSQLQAKAAEGLAAEFEGYRQETAKAAMVDNLQSIRLEGSLSRSVPVPPVYSDVPIYTGASGVAEHELISSGTVIAYGYRVAAVLVPGNERAYLVAAIAQSGELAALQRPLDEAFGDFRVTQRPLTHSKQIEGAARIAALGAAAIFALAFFMKVLRTIFA